MSNSTDDKEKEKPDPDLGSITWDELERLEEIAEGGDIEAQKKLAKLEGVESYEEYKQLGQQVIMDIDQDDNSGIQSILRSIAGASGPMLDLDQEEIAKLMGKAGAFGPMTEIDRAAKTLVASDALGIENDNHSQMGWSYNLLK